MTESGNIKRVSTKQWTQDIEYDPEKLFNKFFAEDINYLLSMGTNSLQAICTITEYFRFFPENLWKTRTPPKPLSWKDAAGLVGDKTKKDENSVRVRDMEVWSIAKCAQVKCFGANAVSLCMWRFY